jgi:hypothetical protein
MKFTVVYIATTDEDGSIRWRVSSKRFDSEAEAQAYADTIAPSRIAHVAEIDN